MPITTITVEKLLVQLYGVQPQRIMPLPQPPLDWRGIFHIEAADSAEWVLRLARHPQAAEGLGATADLLRWLAEQYYPAPRVHLTSAGDLIGTSGEWHTQLLSFVPGEPIHRDPTALGELGALLGRLHRLPLPPNSPISHASLHTLRTETLPLYARLRKRIAAPYVTLVANLAADAETLAAYNCAPSLTHSDCWPPNAVRSPDGTLTLIDWDLAGQGVALLDLGILLLAAHFDLARPLAISADATLVHAILEGYSTVRPLSVEERRLLPLAVRFLPIVHVAAYLDAHPALADDDPVLAKLQARAAAATAIGALVEAHRT